MTSCFGKKSLNGQDDNSHLFESGCENPGTTSTFRVGNKTGTNEWAMSYACNGGGFRQIALSEDLGEAFGEARTERFHHSDPIPTNGMDDHYTNIQYRDTGGTWHQWPSSFCQDDGGSAATNFHVNTISAHEYYTGDGSGPC